MLFDDWTATYCMMVSRVTAELLIQGKGLDSKAITFTDQISSLKVEKLLCLA